MITIFASPKSFSDPHIGVIQRNAIKSWSLLKPDCEVMLLGKEYGIKEAAKEFGARHISDIAYNQNGTPLLDSIFEAVKNDSQNSILAYINSDIVLCDDFIKTVKEINKKNFLAVGRRWDVDISQAINFTDSNWQKNLLEIKNKHGKLHEVWGIDYFVFTREVFKKIPPFAVGRAGFDNWLIFKAKKQGYPIFDATNVITAVHQNHHYNHVAGGHSEVLKGAEAADNYKLADNNFFTIDDADYVLFRRRGKLIKNFKPFFSRGCLKHYLTKTLPGLHPAMRPFINFIKILIR